MRFRDRTGDRQPATGNRQWPERWVTAGFSLGTAPAVFIASCQLPVACCRSPVACFRGTKGAAILRSRWIATVATAVFLGAAPDLRAAPAVDDDAPLTDIPETESPPPPPARGRQRQPPPAPARSAAPS